MLGISQTLGMTTDTPLRVLALGAHADDIEIGCGGTILRLIAERAHLEMHWSILSGGGTEREAEARASAKAFLAGTTNANVSVAAFRDGHFPFTGSMIKQHFEDSFTSIDPHLVLTHSRDDRHQDHRLVSDLTWNTFRGAAAIAEYEIPKWDGDPGHPNAYVQLAASTVEKKVALLLEHFASQQEKPWYDEETFRGLLRLRGIESSCRYAEAFTCRKLVW